MSHGLGLLRTLWTDAGARLLRRLDGLSDEEFFWEHAFGPAVRMFPDLLVPGSAADARTYWQDSRGPITTWLAAATETDLDRTTTTPYGEPITGGDTVRILLEEEIHHGAEIGVLRDLHVRRQ